jgi:hypothetical protein
VDSYQDFEAERIKHMEMIQAVVTRLAGNSFLIKGWAITVTGTFLGFAIDRSHPGLAAAAFLPAVIFWLLDTYYLRAERLFRELYNEVRKGTAPGGRSSWERPARASSRRLLTPSRRRRGTTKRGTLAGFYGLQLAAIALVIVILCKT